jgi:hypothetical protein
MLKEKISPIKKTELFTQKIVTKLSKMWVRDPGSGKNLSRIQGSKRHRIRIRNTDNQHLKRPNSIEIQYQIFRPV